ncbi:MAG: DNA primase [Lachnospiraceae bacterium]|nr:DNA primase [Lachnospiraceae bacterium]
MPFYSDELIEEIRSGNDIVDVISEYVKLTKRGSSYLGLCPFHNEKTPSFAVSGSKQLYHCFGCGAGGNVVTFLMEYENYSFLEALEALAGRIGITLPKQEMSGQARAEADWRTRILEINKAAARYFYAQLRMEQGKRAMDYLKGRQLSRETMQKFGLGYANKYSDDLYRYLRQQGYGDEILKEAGLVTLDERRGGYDKFWNRVIFPIMDVNHRVIGFGGRVMGEGEPKYLNSPETRVFDKSRNLYGLHLAKSSRKPQILLCEGYMDVIALHQAGFDNAVASLGTAFTPGHANLLKRYVREVYLTFDSDGAGIRAALRAIPILKEAGLTARVIDMKPYKDPDEFIKALGTEAYQQRIDEAQNSFLFEVSVLEQQFDLHDPEGKTSFFNEIAKKLLEFEEELERNNYIEAVASKYQVGFENLRKLVGRMAAQGMTPRPALKSGVQEKKKKENGMDKSQKLLLTWLIEDPGLFEVIRPFIEPKDFVGEPYEKTAKLLFAQYEEGAVNPAKIVSMFPDEEQQREVASLFHTRIGEIETKQEREKALKETIVRMKQNSINYRSTHLKQEGDDGAERLLEDKRKLQEIQKLHISIN